MKLDFAKPFRFVFIAILLSAFSTHAQQDSLSVNTKESDDVFPEQNCVRKLNQLEIGLLLQKSYHFYWENGITVTYRPSNIMNCRLGVGLNVLSSRLGSALGTNAIKQDQILLFGQYDFLPSKTIKPFVQLNFGYLKAQYDQDIFSELEDESLLTSINIGVTGTVKEMLVIKGSLGYNIIGGNGQSGLATVYPLIFHLSVQYKLDL
ncbi:MAG: hypothetical protein ACJAZ2_001192 [Glaciecola sp.]|jgi:hypothetical protein